MPTHSAQVCVSNNRTTSSLSQSILRARGTVSVSVFSLIAGDISSTTTALLLPQNAPRPMPLPSVPLAVPSGRSRHPNYPQRERSTSAPNVCIVNPSDTSSLEVCYACTFYQCGTWLFWPCCCCFATFSYLNSLDLHMGLGGVGPPHPALLSHGVVPGAAYTLQCGPQLQTQHSHPWALTYKGGAHGGVRGNHLRPPRPPHYSVSRTRLAAKSGGTYHELPPLISASEAHSTSAPNFHTLLAGQDSLEVCDRLLPPVVVAHHLVCYVHSGWLASLVVRLYYQSGLHHHYDHYYYYHLFCLG